MREMSINRLTIVVGVIVALAILLFLPNETIRAQQAGSNTVKIGVLAKRGVEHCLKKWTPTADYLTDKIPGYSFTIVPLGFDKINSTVEHGEVDFILANPSFYVELEHYYGVSRITTLKNLYAGKALTTFGGVIFHWADRKDIKCLNDLKDKSFMAVEEESFGGWRMSWRELKEHGIDPYRDFASLSFGGTQDAVVYAVRDGRVDAGSVRTTTLERMALEGKVRLEDFRVITHDHTHHIHEHACYFPFSHSTETYPEWPFARVKHTSDILAEKVTASLLEMSADSPAARAANCVGWTIPLNYQPVHECLKYLRIGPYKDYGKITVLNILKYYWPLLLGIAILLTVIVLVAFRAIRLNRKLQESKKHTQLILNSVQVGIVLIDTETHTIIDVNHIAANMIGVPKEELIGMICFKFFCPPKMWQCPITDLGQVLDNSERILIRADDASMPILKTVVPVTVNGRKCLLESFINITELKQAERELRESRRYTRELIETSLDPLVMISAEGKITDVNRATENVTGYPREELIGTDFSDYFTDPEKATQGYQQVFREEHVFDYPLEIKHRDGKITPVLYNASVYFNTKGEVAGVFAAARDITQQILTEEKLRKTSEALQSIMDSATEEIIITTDQTGTILNWNEGARRLLGYEPEEVINKGSIRIFHTEEYLNSGVMERNLKCMITTGEPLEEEPTYVARGGRTFPVHQIVTPRFDKEGKFTGMLGMARDITERKRAETDRKLLEENLYQSDKMASIGQLAAGVAHEINNPIGFISSNLNTMNKYLWRLIKHFTGDDPNATENRQRIDVIIEDFGDAISESLEGADRVKKIVADLKSFSRVDAGEVEYTDLNEGLETTLNIVWNQLKYTCKIEKEFGDIPQIECFPNRINQVFMNLLVNAGQAIKGKSGLIRIKTWADDDHVHVSIRDNGCGIPKENLPKLFDAFFTTKEVGKGTGLGLSLAYDIVSKHGGTITVDSEVGKGTEFVVTLPLSGIPEPASIPTV